jgi:hypothetical protein
MAINQMLSLRIIFPDRRILDLRRRIRQRHHMSMRFDPQKHDPRVIAEIRRRFQREKMACNLPGNRGFLSLRKIRANQVSVKFPCRAQATEWIIKTDQRPR